MFTGIILATGVIVSIKTQNGMTQVCVNCSGLYSKDVAVALGDSISINGICLTVVKIQSPNLFFDVSFETLNSTNIGALNIGTDVNLEPAMSANGRFGGHIVSGHVDGIGVVSSINNMGKSILMKINAPSDILRYIIKKGSVTVDGVGLTVVDVLRDGFSIVIIPHTSMITTLSHKKVGDTVNLEADILGKYVEKFVSNQSKSDDTTLLNKLTERGFIR
ncbi:MAG: riboflavin synthase [Nitrospirae bacterium]|nr:riboflavin synthase [Nitrospirota bacterium]